MSAAEVAGQQAAWEGANDQSALFAAYIAHQLRTPLATQRALLELALADPDADTEAWREIGTDVLDACRQQEQLLDACLALSRSRTDPSGCDPVELGSVVAGLLHSRDLRRFTVRSSLDPALTIGDRALIERLVENLLVNAVRHNRVGGWISVMTRRFRGGPCSRSRTPDRRSRPARSRGCSSRSNSTRDRTRPRQAGLDSDSQSQRLSPTRTAPASPHGHDEEVVSGSRSRSRRRSNHAWWPRIRPPACRPVACYPVVTSARVRFSSQTSRR